MITIHATTIGIDGAGIILRGPSGSGKSDFALRMIDGGAALVADDQTMLFVENNRLMAQSPPEIAGKMEIRGVGIVQMNAPSAVPVALVVELVDESEVPRVPTFDPVELVGFKVPVMHLAPFELSATVKLKIALRNMPNPD